MINSIVFWDAKSETMITAVITVIQNLIDNFSVQLVS